MTLLCFLSFFALNAQSISGTIHTADGMAMEGITVKVNDESVITESSGTYTFQNLSSAPDYMIRPSKEENDPMNGVNMFDIVVLHRHILGLVPFSSPYQKVAADVNGSGTITTMDVVKLRRLILRLDQDFGELAPWRFIDSNFDMENGSLAHLPEFPEERYLEAVVASMSSIDFKGVKLGDVNFSASVNFGDETEERNKETLNVLIEKDIQDDYTIVRFQTKDFNQMAAFQFTLNFPTADYDFVKMETAQLPNFNMDNLGLNFQEEGKLTIAWQDVEAVTLEDHSTLFQLKFKHNKTVHSKDILSISSDITPAMAFKTNGETLQVAGQTVNLSTSTESIQLENFPNPFHDQTTVRFSLEKDSPADLRILNSTGEVVKVIQGTFSRGYNELTVSKDDLNGNKGLLFLQLNIKNKTIIKKIMFN